jgi:hypothetical protein
VHVRTALAALLVIGVSTACSSSSDGSKNPDPYCVKLAAVSNRLVSAEQEFFTGGGSGQEALARIVGELQSLQSDSPPDIRAALADLVSAFQRAEPALQDPSKQGRQKLAAAAQVLSTDGKKLSEYVTSKCK